nr:hypothetical protein [Marinifilum sp. N1E240]
MTERVNRIFIPLVPQLSLKFIWTRSNDKVANIGRSAGYNFIDSIRFPFNKAISEL